MRKIEIQFSCNHALCVFPEHREHLSQAITELNLKIGGPVIVLIGGFIQEPHQHVTEKAIKLIAAYAEEKGALIICGGSDLGVMASIGRTRTEHRHTFPLLGINLERLVTWRNGPKRKKLLSWKERIPLAEGYSHFMLVPGSKYGEDSSWIAEAAVLLSNGNKSVTVLANGGTVARKDVALSLENNRTVLVLAGTGRYADELASQANKPAQTIPVNADDENALKKALQMATQISKEN